MKYHEHDSESSIYLDSEIVNGNKYDYYFADQGKSATVIARFGELGEYYSGLIVLKSFLNKDKDIIKQLKSISKNTKEEDMCVLARAALLSIDKEYLNKDLSKNTRNLAIKELEEKLKNNGYP